MDLLQGKRSTLEFYCIFSWLIFAPSSSPPPFTRLPSCFQHSFAPHFPRLCSTFGLICAKCDVLTITEKPILIDFCDSDERISVTVMLWHWLWTEVASIQLCVHPPEHHGKMLKISCNRFVVATAWLDPAFVTARGDKLLWKVIDRSSPRGHFWAKESDKASKTHKWGRDKRQKDRTITWCPFLLI